MTIENVSYYAPLFISLHHKSLFHHLDNALYSSTWHACRQAQTQTMNVVGLCKYDTDEQTVLCKLCCRLVPTNTSNLFYHLRKSHVKLNGESLHMRATNVQSRDQNKPKTQTLQQASACVTTYGKKKKKRKENQEDNGCCCNYHLGTNTQFTQLEK